MSASYLADIVVLLAAAVVAVPLSRMIGLGVVPGFLIAGVVVGPSVLGLIDNREEIAHLAEFGVVLLLFMIGIELNVPGTPIVNEALTNGLRINCTQDTVLRLLPAMTITPAEVDEAFEILTATMKKTESELVTS